MESEKDNFETSWKRFKALVKARWFCLIRIFSCYSVYAFRYKNDSWIGVIDRDYNLIRTFWGKESIGLLITSILKAGKITALNAKRKS